MAGSANTIILLGTSPDSYYVGHGRRHFVENMSLSFMNHARTALNITMTHFNADINQDISDYLRAANGKPGAEFISFPDSEESSQYFVKGKKNGNWNAVLPDYFIQQLSTKQRTVPNFDTDLTGILFGQGKTHICLLTTGFDAHFDAEHIAKVRLSVWGIRYIIILVPGPARVQHTWGRVVY
ncbi:hypothetical protein C8R44DRAFT_878957 [Mycena epipterygia]|nr:hypothetical protein C8R44DRAFT_878957 [Mycena epipterygia]